MPGPPHKASTRIPNGFLDQLVTAHPPFYSSIRSGPLTLLVGNSYSRVVSVAIARFLTLLRRKPTTVRFAIVSLAVMAGWPLLLNAAFFIWWRSIALTSLPANLWLLGFAVINFAALLVPWWAWRMLHRAGPSLDELLEFSPDRIEVEAWLRRRLRITPQLLLSGILAGLSLPTLAQAADALAGKVDIHAASYVMVAWTTILLANGLYWVYAIAELPARIYVCNQLNLVWHDPSSTPGISSLSGGYVFTATAVGAGALLVEGLALLVPNRDSSPILWGGAIVVPVVAVITALLVGAQSHYWLYLIIKRYKAATLSMIEGYIGGPDKTTLHDKNSMSAIELYRIVSSSPNFAISTVGLVQFSAALIAVLLAYLLQQLS
jgi:hypothetical protein